MEDTLLFDSNAPNICKRPAIEENISKKLKQKSILLLTLNYVPSSSAQHAYLSQGLAPPILASLSLQYLAGYFSLAFLEGWWSLLSSEETSLHLDPTIWDPSVLSKRVASSASTVTNTSP